MALMADATPWLVSVDARDDHGSSVAPEDLPVTHGEISRKNKGVGPPSDYPESSWKVFWLVLALLGSGLDNLWRT